MERKFVVNLRSKFLIFMVLGAIFAGRAAWAQCCWCEDNDGCPEGQEIYDGQCVGTWGSCCLCEDMTYCDQQCGGQGQYCASFTESCPGLSANYKCKLSYDVCSVGSEDGCRGYKSCDSLTGILGPDTIMENCHRETSGSCYSNTRACSVFDIDVAYGAWTCSKNSQTGSAQWTPSEDAWDTSGCGCNVVNKDIDMDIANTVVKCKKANAVYYVADSDKYATKKVSDYVHYSTKRRWCAKCYPGYLPVTDGSPDSYGIYLRPNNNDNWGVASCATQVIVPDYAPGCTINFGLATGDDVMAECRGICPTGFETEANGATSISDCVSQYTETYEDSTGTFVLTSLDSCP